ncbi:MAG: hypothetical protein CMN15_04410 [Roseovarius sp.]|nr:hypothetical protein [Roseovarius sp.]
MPHLRALRRIDARVIANYLAPIAPPHKGFAPRPPALGGNLRDVPPRFEVINSLLASKPDWAYTGATLPRMSEAEI